MWRLDRPCDGEGCIGTGNHRIRFVRPGNRAPEWGAVCDYHHRLLRDAGQLIPWFVTFPERNIR